MKNNITTRIRKRIPRKKKGKAKLIKHFPVILKINNYISDHDREIIKGQLENIKFNPKSFVVMGGDVEIIQIKSIKQLRIITSNSKEIM